MIRTACVITACCASVLAVMAAEKNAPIDARPGILGAPAIVFDFDQPLDPPFTAVKGTWKVVDGILIGQELASDQHAAVLHLQKNNRNSVIRFSFKMGENTDGFSFSMNHARGHLFRVVIRPDGMQLLLDKDKRDPESKGLVLGNVKGKFDKGTWHTLQVEMRGNDVVAATDQGLKIEASHASLDQDKPGYRFVMKGNSLSLDDVQIWELK